MSLFEALISVFKSSNGSDSEPLQIDTTSTMPTTLADLSARGGMNQLPGFTDMIAVLFECLSIITLGYLSCRFKLISPEAKDLGAYLSTFALPMIIFLNIAQMEFQTINLSFLICMLMAKLLLFIAVTIFTLAISYPRNFSYAGALSILATQSNDFALGYPVIKSLYGETKPEMLSYLGLMAPIQLLILNPLGIVMLEFEKSRQRARKLQKQLGQSHASDGDGNGAGCPIHASNGVLGIRNSSMGADERVRKPQRDQIKSDELERQQVEKGNVDSAVVLVATTKTAAKLESDRCSMTSHEAGSIHSSSLIRSNGQIIGCLHPSIIGKKNLDAIIDSTWPDAECRSTFGIVHHQCNLKASLMGANPLVGLMNSSLNHCSSTSGSEESIDSLDCRLVGCTTNSAIVNSRHHKNVAPDRRCTRPKQIFSQTLSGLNIRRRSINRRASLQQTNIMMPYEEPSDHDDGQQLPACKCGTSQHTQPLVDLGFLKALSTNPLIIASIVALAVNLIHGPELPKFVTKVSNTIAASFAAPALLIIGLSMYGKFELLLKNPNDLLLATILVISKVMILPSIMRTIALLILPHNTASEEVPTLTDFSYLYGLLPTAPGACIIAQQYGVLGNVVSISMLLSTFISAPLLLGASYIINQSSESYNLSGIMSLLIQTIRLSSVMTLFLSLATLYLLYKAKKQEIFCQIRRGSASLFGNIASTTRSSLNSSSISALHDRARQATLATSDLLLARTGSRRATELFTFLLVLTQLLIGLGGCFWLFMEICVDPNEDELPKAPVVHFWNVGSLSNFLCAIQYIMSSSGILLARFLVLSMIVTTYAYRFSGHRLASSVLVLMFRVFIMLAISLILCLIFESSHLKWSPIEASLPSWSLSLALRLTYNVVVLLMSVPLLIITFRAENKSNYATTISNSQSESTTTRCHGVDNGMLVAECQLAASSPSLSSTTTTNTNLDLGQTTIDSKARTTSGVARQLSEPPLVLDAQTLPESVLLDLEGETSDQRPNDSHMRQTSARPTPLHETSQINLSQETNPNYDRQNLVDFVGHDLSNSTNPGEISSQQPGQIIQDQEQIESHHQQVLGVSLENCPRQEPSISPSPTFNTAYNRHSTLMVFMLIQVVLNTTSIIQVLLQDKPLGTMIQVEITALALDFGQGLITFLAIGTRNFSRSLISTCAIQSPFSKRA